MFSDCALFVIGNIEQLTPVEADATGEDYCFERHVKVVGAASKGDYGFVDVWKRGRFAWEYKIKDAQNRQGGLSP